LNTSLKESAKTLRQSGAKSEETKTQWVRCLMSVEVDKSAAEELWEMFQILEELPRPLVASD